MPKINVLKREDLNKLIKSRELIKDIIKNSKNLSKYSKEYLQKIEERLSDRIEYHKERRDAIL